MHHISLLSTVDSKKLMTDFHSLNLKEYYEIVGESRPLSGFFPTHADFFTEMHYNHETKPSLQVSE